MTHRNIKKEKKEQETTDTKIKRQKNKGLKKIRQRLQ